MSTIRQTSRTVRGFTLTEAAIVLGIVGLILSAIWVAAGSVYANYRVGKTAEQLLSIVQSVRSLHSGVSQFPAAGDITLDLARAGVPARWSSTST